MKEETIREFCERVIDPVLEKFEKLIKKKH